MALASTSSKGALARITEPSAIAMDQLTGISLFLVLVLANLAVLAAGRYAAARALGITQARFPFGDGPPESYDRASRWARPAIVIAGPVANYLCAATVMFLGALSTGDVAPPGTTVEVVPDKPAAIAGIRDGDRILAINGAPIVQWESISAMVQAHPGEPLDVLVARDGKELHIEVTPSNEGRVGVTPATVHVPISVPDALWRGLSGPPRVLYGIGSSLIYFLTGRVEGELAGPVGIVKETARASKKGYLLGLLGALNAYILPLFVLISVVTIPRRRRSAAPASEHGPTP